MNLLQKVTNILLVIALCTVIVSEVMRVAWYAGYGWGSIHKDDHCVIDTVEQ
jgi:hypothetical protein